MADNIGVSVLEAIGADATVQAITTRGYVDGHMPQNATLPAYAIDVITNNANEPLDGTSMAMARVRVDAYADDRASANDLSESIRTEVLKSTHKGTLGVTNTLNVREITIASGPHWEVDRPLDASDQFRPFTRTDYMINYVQTRPS